ncbi:MAG: hypothetical protein ND866_30070, partial [Pyrinomonadaceae bacterium]|nr:hypothetical protein [Pyrinomonadaceae bacterium]
IAPAIAHARGFRSVTKQAELLRLSFSSRQCQVPTLLIPAWNVNGEIGLYQRRPDSPQIERGKAVKYETPRGAHMIVDVPPRACPWLSDPHGPRLLKLQPFKALSRTTVRTILRATMNTKCPPKLQALSGCRPRWAMRTRKAPGSTPARIIKTMVARETNQANAVI